jgi:predicted metal-dependent phosphoesterase TrpH
MKFIDLHLHSTYSDGTLPPELLVKEAQRLGLEAISLTDHDTTEGVAETIYFGSLAGIEVLPGVELSAHFDTSSVHILGYGVEFKDPIFNSRLEKIQKARDRRNQKIISRLNSLGINITKEELETCSGAGQAGRPHFAQLLIQNKVVHTLDEAFDQYLGQNGMAYVPRKILLASDAIQYINEAGGIAILAHPVTIDQTMATIPKLIESLTRFGLGGIEVYYPIHSKNVRKTLLEICSTFDLVATGGSDFHDHNRPVNRLGKIGKNQRLRYDVYENLKERLKSRTK